MQLKGKRVVLTGASSGIGRDLLILLLKEGAQVLAASRNIEKVGIERSNLFTYTCDVSKPADIDGLFQEADKSMGGIDIFIANAGFAYYERLKEPNWKHITAIMDVNFNAAVYGLEKMKARKDGGPFQYMITSSAMAYIPIPGYALYSASKAAVHNFARAYRSELEKDQLLQIVYPIATRTRFFKEAGNSPVPWPNQSARVVAKKMLRGLKTGKKRVSPSFLFNLMMFLDRFLPFVTLGYKKQQEKIFKKRFRK